MLCTVHKLLGPRPLGTQLHIFFQVKCLFYTQPFVGNLAVQNKVPVDEVDLLISADGSPTCETFHKIARFVLVGLEFLAALRFDTWSHS